jgi:hypothetical protein
MSCNSSVKSKPGERRNCYEPKTQRYSCGDPIQRRIVHPNLDIDSHAPEPLFSQWLPGSI